MLLDQLTEPTLNQGEFIIIAIITNHCYIRLLLLYTIVLEWDKDFALLCLGLVRRSGLLYAHYILFVHHYIFQQAPERMSEQTIVSKKVNKWASLSLEWSSKRFIHSPSFCRLYVREWVSKTCSWLVSEWFTSYRKKYVRNFQYSESS